MISERYSLSTLPIEALPYSACPRLIDDRLQVLLPLLEGKQLFRKAHAGSLRVDSDESRFPLVGTFRQNRKPAPTMGCSKMD